MSEQMMANIEKLKDGEAAKVGRAALAKALAEEEATRTRACAKELDEVLKRHGCVVMAEPYIKDGIIVAGFKVISDPRREQG